MASSSSSPCAACKFLRRKCTQGCVFAPYFPPDQPQKFSNVHRVFGASNVAKILNDLNPAQREDAVNSLAYEAEARLRDPVYGCVGYISLLQHKLKQVQYDLYNAKKELSSYIGPAAMNTTFIAHPAHHALMNPPHHHLLHGNPSSVNPLAMSGMGINFQTSGGGLQHAMQHQQHHQQHQQQLIEAQQLAMAAAVAREQELLRSYEQQQQQQEFARYNSAFEGGGGGLGPGLNPMDPSVVVAGGAASGLALVPEQAYDNSFHVQHHQHQQQQQLHELHQHHQRAGSDEGRSGVGPSS